MGKTIGERVRSMRKARGLTQVELAARAQIGQSALSLIEVGNTKYLRGGTLVRLAEALSVSPSWLASGEGDPQKPLPTTTDDAIAHEILAQLSPEHREAWIQLGRSLAQTQPAKPSKADPYPQPRRSVAKKH